MNAERRTTESRLLRSSAAAYASQLGRTLIRIGAELVLARLLLPAEHGLFERALGLMILASALRDLGLVYQAVRDEREPFGTVALWVTTSGGLLSVAFLVAAPLFAVFDPQLPAVVRGLSLYVFLDGLAVVPKAYFERRLAVQQLLLPELLRGLLFAGLSISLAWSGLGVWSFVLAELAGALFFALWVWGLAWQRMPRRVQPRLLPDLLRRSYLLSLVWLATAAVPLVGRYVLDDSATVGNYNKAHLWALRLHAFVLPALARVFYPALVEYREDRRRFVEAYGLGTLTLAALEVLAAYFLFFNAETVLLAIFLGPGWEPAVPLLRILCFLPLLEPLSRLGGEVLKVGHEDRLWLIIALANLGSLVLFGLLFTSRWGAAGMAWANYLLLGNLLMAWRLWRICGPHLLVLLRRLLLIDLVPLPLFLLAAHLFEPGWGRFGASLVAAAVAGTLLFWRLHPPFLAFFAVRQESGESPP